MKQEEQPLTPQEIKKQALLEPIIALKDPKFVVPPGMLIPLKTQVYVQQITTNSGNQKSQGGIILPTVSPNTVVPFTGQLVCVGYECDDFIFPGLFIWYNGQIQYMEVMIGGKIYLRMWQDDILGILPPDTYVYQGVHSAEYMRRKERMEQFEGYYQRRDIRLANEQDKTNEAYKKLAKESAKKKR